MLAGQLDLVQDRDEGLDDGRLPRLAVARGALAGAAHEPLVLLLEVVQVGAGPGQVVSGLGGRQRVVLPGPLSRAGGLGPRGGVGVLPVVHRAEGLLDGVGQGGVHALGALVVAGALGTHLESSSSTISASTMLSSSAGLPACWEPEACAAWSEA